MTRRSVTIAALLSATTFACGGSSPSRSSAGGAAPFLADGTPRGPENASCARQGSTAAAPEARESSAIAVARTASGLLAYVANADAAAVHVIDVDKEQLAGSVRLDGAPRQLLVLPDGRVVVSLVDRDSIEVLEPVGEPPGALRHLCSRQVPAGPFGMATSPDGGKLLVTSTWAATLSVFDTERMSLAGVVATERAPAGVTVPTGERAFISHVSGAALTVIDLEPLSGAHRTVDLRLGAATPIGELDALAFRRPGSQGFALTSVVVGGARKAPEAPPPIGAAAPSRPPRAPSAKRAQEEVEPRALVVVPMVSVDPGDIERPGDIYYGPPPTLGVPKQAPVSVVVDPAAERALTRHVVAVSPEAKRAECYLPRGVGFRRSTERLYVACRGSDQLLELDARVADPMRTPLSRFEIPRGAAGVAVVDREGLAIVYGELGSAVRIFRLDGSPGSEVDLPRSEAGSPAERLGRELFHRTDDDRIASDGLACASCHPDGREDGLTWSTPEGPRQTIMLAGRVAGTAPYGWSRGQSTLEGYIEDTTRRLGRGVNPEDASALAAYLLSLRGPSRSAPPARVEDGRAVFDRGGCTTCHAGNAATDQRPHDVGGGALDTPSLRYVGLTAPYFHDGRYPSLEALIDRGDHGMGGTRNLSSDDRASLRAYLESL